MLKGLSPHLSRQCPYSLRTPVPVLSCWASVFGMLILKIHTKSCKKLSFKDILFFPLTDPCRNYALILKWKQTASLQSMDELYVHRDTLSSLLRHSSRRAKSIRDTDWTQGVQAWVICFGRTLSSLPFISVVDKEAFHSKYRAPPPLLLRVVGEGVRQCPLYPVGQP